MKRYLSVTIPRRHPAAVLSCCLMALAGIARLVYYLPRENDPFTWVVQLALPVLAVCAFLVGMALGGNKAKAGVLIALVLGVVFFLAKATTFTPLHQALCTLLYLGVLVLFGGTLLGCLPTKKLLYPLFGLPLVYHILVEDTRKYFFSGAPVWDWLPEISVLAIMAGLLSLSVSLQTERR